MRMVWRIALLFLGWGCATPAKGKSFTTMSGYACSWDRTLKIVDLHNHLNCSTLLQTGIATHGEIGKITIWVSNVHSHKQTATACWKTITLHRAWAYFLQNNRPILETKTWNEQVSREECDRMVNSGTTPSGKRLEQIGETLWGSVTADKEFPYYNALGWCCSWQEARYEDYFREHGPLVVDANGQVSSTLSDVHFCKDYKKGFCLTADNKTVLWDVANNVLDPLEPWRKVTAYRSGDLYLVKGENIAFRANQNPPITIMRDGQAHKVFSTFQGIYFSETGTVWAIYLDDPRAFVFDTNPKLYESEIARLRAKRQSGPGKIPDAAIFIPPEIDTAARQYILEVVRVNRRDSAHAVGFEICKTADSIGEAAINGLSSESGATMAIRKILKTDLVAARPSSGYLIVHPCQLVTGLNTIPMNGTCTTRIPVMLPSGHRSYLDPITSILHASAGTIPCTEMSPTILLDGSEIRIYNPQSGTLQVADVMSMPLVNPMEATSRIEPELDLVQTHGRSMNELNQRISAEDVMEHEENRRLVAQALAPLVRESPGSGGGVMSAMAHGLIWSLLGDFSWTSVAAWLAFLWAAWQMTTTVLLPAALRAAMPPMPSIFDIPSALSGGFNKAKTMVQNLRGQAPYRPEMDMYGPVESVGAGDSLLRPAPAIPPIEETAFSPRK